MMTMRFGSGGRPDGAIFRKLGQVRWLFVLLLCIVGAVGVVMLYSAADGNFEPWAVRHVIRFAFALGLLLIVAITDIRIWMRYAYMLYAGALVLLVAVEIAGTIGMGAQRWIDLGIINASALRADEDRADPVARSLFPWQQRRGSAPAVEADRSGPAGRSCRRSWC